MLNFGNVNTEIPLPNSCCPSVKCAWSAQSEINCGNAIAEIGEKKLWQTNCGNDIAEIGKNNLWQTNCGNAIAEVGEKKNYDKLIVAMALPK